MSRGLVAVALLLASCASGPPASGPGSADRLLQRADDQLIAAQYRNALALYDEYLQTHPNEASSPRVRTARTAVERLLVSQVELDRLRREVETRQAEIDRLRRERDTRQAELERLKADLERLRRIDLRQAPALR